LVDLIPPTAHPAHGIKVATIRPHVHRRMDLGQFDPAHGIKVAKVHLYVHRRMDLGQFDPAHGIKVAKVHPYVQRRMELGRFDPAHGLNIPFGVSPDPLRWAGLPGWLGFGSGGFAARLGLRGELRRRSARRVVLGVLRPGLGDCLALAGSLGGRSEHRGERVAG
jgi:hypothetical protein